MSKKLTKLLIGKTYYDNGVVALKKLSPTLAPGLYDADDKELASWNKLTKEDGLNLENNYASYSAEGTAYSVLKNYETAAKLSIPNSITNIGSLALANCTQLTEIYLPKSLTKLGEYACYNNQNLVKITIPKNVESIPAYAFANCSGLEEVYLSKGLLSIEESAFSGCISLNYIKLPSSIINLGKSAFMDCESLESINLPKQITQINDRTFSGCVKLNSISIPNGVTYIGDYAFFYCRSLGEIYIPESVTRIDDGAFCNCTGLKKVTLKESSNDQELGNKVFANCINIEDLIIPDSVNSLGENLLYGCNLLKSIDIPFLSTRLGDLFGKVNKDGENICSQITEEKDNALTYTKYAIPKSLQKVTVRSGIIIPGAFSGCENLTEVVLPTDLTTIPGFCFYGCRALAKYSFQDELTTLGKEAFLGCTSLTSIKLPNKINSISEGVFKDCTGIKNIDYQISINKETQIKMFENCGSTAGTTLKISNATAIYGAAFALSNISKVEFLDDKCTKIHVNAFEDCTCIKDLVIPNSVAEISAGALSGCITLESLAVPFSGLKAEPSSVSESHIGYIFGTAVKEENAEKTEKTDSGSSTYYYIPKSLKKVSITKSALKEKAFYNCYNLEKILLPESCAEIPSNCFYNCNKLVSISIPKQVTTIGESAFQSCSSLISVQIPDSVATIGAHAFSGCNSLLVLTLPDSITSIGKNAFYDNKNLKTIYYNATSLSALPEDNNVFYNLGAGLGGKKVEVIVGENVTIIPDYLFYVKTTTDKSYPRIGGVYFEGASCEKIGAYAFAYCEDLTDISIPNSVRVIGENAFIGCNLSTFSVPEGTTRIEDSAFKDNTTLKRVEMPSTVTEIGDYAFSGCTSLEEIVVNDIGMSTFRLRNRQKPIVDLSKITTIGTEAFKGCSSIEKIVAHQVRTINEKAFADCAGLKSIELPESIGEGAIAGEAFLNCSSLEEITLPNATSLGASILRGCTSLTSIDAPYLGEDLLTGVTTNGTTSNNHLLGYWFGEAGTEEEGVTQYLYNGNQQKYAIPSSLSSLTIKNGVLVKNALSNCATLTNINLEGCSAIDTQAMIDCTGLEYIAIPNSVTVLGNDILKGANSLKEIYYNANFTATYNSTANPLGNAGSLDVESLRLIVGNKVQRIPQYLCYKGRITDLTFEENSICERIDSYSFAYCNNLRTILVPETITYLDSGVFSSCTSLTDVEYRAKAVTNGGSAFNDSGLANEGMEIVISKDVESIPSYLLGTSTKNVKSIVFGRDEYGQSALKSIGSSAFYGSQLLTEIDIPDSVETIGSEAFGHCVDLEEVTIPFVGQSRNATSSSGLFGYVFGGSSSSEKNTSCRQWYTSSGGLTYYIPSSLKTITVHGGTLSYGAFSGLTMIETINLPRGMGSKEDYIFYNCTSLCNLNGFDFSNCSAIGNYAFTNCEKLPFPVLSDSIKGIGTSAFANCKLLTSIDGLTEIESISLSAFEGCIGLTSISLSNRLTTIETSAFQGCTELASVEFAENSALSRINYYAFDGCKKLTRIHLPDSIISLQFNIFNGCDSLEEITIPFVGQTKGQSGSDSSVFSYIFSHSASGDRYEVKSYYSSGYRVGYLPNTLKKVTVSGGFIPQGAFDGCTSITEIILKPGVNGVQYNAFRNCTALTEITLPSTLTSFDYSALNGATSLERINYNIPSLENRSSGNGILYPSSNTSESGIKVVFGEGVTTIPKYLFSVSSSYTKPRISEYVFLGNQCTSIGTGALTSSWNNVQCVFDKYTTDDIAPEITSTSLPGTDQTTIVLQNEAVKEKWIEQDSDWSSYKNYSFVSA